MKGKLLPLLFGGILPVIAFTVIEETYGTLWGTVAGMVFSLGEMAWEWRAHGKVSMVTLATSALILVLGGISLWANDGIWFKLQPALMEAAFALLLWGSLLLGKSFLQSAMEKSGSALPAPLLARMPALTFRLGLFFFLHALLVTWAALHWSTTNWALLKGVGFTLSLFVYMALEMLWLRSRLKGRYVPPAGGPSPGARP